MTDLLTFLLPNAALSVVVALAAHCDWRHRRIPNWLTFALALGGLAAAVVRPDLTFPQALGGLGIGLLLPLVLYALGMLGAGDAKLLAAIGAWMGPVGVLWVLLFTALAGAAMSLGLALWQGRIRVLLRNTSLIGMSLLTTRRTGWIAASEVAHSDVLKKSTLPYAVAILAGLLGTQALLLSRAWPF